MGSRRRTSRRRTSRRRARKAESRASLEKNKLSPTAKVVMLGVLGTAGAAGLYFLLRPKVPPDEIDGVPTGPLPSGSPGAACQQMHRDLVAYQQSPSPDPTLVAQKEAAIAECLEALKQAGADVPPFLGRLSEGNQLYTQINALFDEYRGTDYADALKRNNIRNEMVRRGGLMADAFKAAATAASGDVELQSVRQSMERSLDAAVTRRLCYLYDQRGCGRFAVNEPHGNDKAREVKERVIAPLLEAYITVVDRLGGAGAERVGRGSPEFLRILLRPCEALQTYIDQQFAHYKATDYSDALKRNNTRAAILAAGSSLVECLRASFDAARKHLNTAAMRNVGQLTEKALQASVQRWICYKNGLSGCGRLGVNEPHGNDKANDEMSRVTDPLFAIYKNVAALTGDVSDYTKMTASRLEMCDALKTRIDREFAHYKATDYSDALKRNNTRGSMLAFGAEMVACYRKAVTAARGEAAVSAVFASAVSALESAVSRKICYRYDQRGCGRFGVNEPHGNTKANELQQRVITPLTSVVKDAASAMMQAQLKSGACDFSGADVKLMQTMMRECEAANTYIDNKFNEYKGVAYTDAVRRNNIRSVILSEGRGMVACFGGLRPSTNAGRAVVRAAISAAIQKSRKREACYRAGTAGCGRFGVNEPDGATKAQQEAAAIGTPLAALLTSSALVPKSDMIPAHCVLTPSQQRALQESVRTGTTSQAVQKAASQIDWGARLRAAMEQG